MSMGDKLIPEKFGKNPVIQSDCISSFKNRQDLLDIAIHFELRMATYKDPQYSEQMFFRHLLVHTNEGIFHWTCNYEGVKDNVNKYSYQGITKTPRFPGKFCVWDKTKAKIGLWKKTYPYIYQESQFYSNIHEIPSRLSSFRNIHNYLQEMTKQGKEIPDYRAIYYT